MKTTSYSSSSKGFTLVELLVVVAIIAVLASATFAIGPAMMNKARKLSAQAAASNLSNAVEQFYTEYSALPGAGSNTPVATNSTAGVAVLNILAGIETSTTPENPRKIRFFSYKEAKGTGASARDGLVYSGNTISSFVDPWGEPYFIMMDNETTSTRGYDEMIEFTPSKNPKVTLRGKRVAVYSLGVEDPLKAAPTSLVKTW
jgi:prepilin-type N-terminal cleavage/methylation domain-containing protein